MTKEEIKEELEKCNISPAYFYNKYCELRDKEGNIIPKKDVTDKEIEAYIENYKETKRLAENLYNRSGDKFYLLWLETFKKTTGAALDKAIAVGLESLRKEYESFSKTD